MNILYDELPKSVCLDGREYAVNTDFRVWLKIGILLETGRLEEISEAVMLCYRQLPPNIETAIKGMLEFYTGTPKRSGGTQKGKAVYSFENDGEYILSAFMHDYGIDLTVEKLHWYRFKALFSSLGNDTMFVKIMQYRSVDLGKIKDREQKKFYRRMKRIYALPDSRTEEEKERDMAEMLAGMM